MKYCDQFLAYKQARTEADKILLPDELFEADNALRELEERSKHSQRDLDEMVDTAPVKEVLQRNISALENAIEAMTRMTESLNARISQHRSEKS